MVENTINLGHHMLFSKTSILAMKSRHKDQLIKEAIWAAFCPNNMNSVNKFSLNRSWKPFSEVREGLPPPPGLKKI
jgi:hypothetical protein